MCPWFTQPYVFKYQDISTDHPACKLTINLTLTRQAEIVK